MLGKGVLLALADTSRACRKNCNRAYAPMPHLRA
jgi:hypothetical protein